MVGFDRVCGVQESPFQESPFPRRRVPFILPRFFYYPGIETCPIRSCRMHRAARGVLDEAGTALALPVFGFGGKHLAPLHARHWLRLNTTDKNGMSRFLAHFRRCRSRDFFRCT